MLRRFATTLGKTSAMRLVSALVVFALKLSRTEPCIAVNGTPIAFRTWLGSSEPLEQALPLLAQMP